MSGLSDQREEEANGRQTLSNAIFPMPLQGIPQVHGARTCSGAPEISSEANSNAVPRVTRSLTTNAPTTGGRKATPKSCKDTTCDIPVSETQELAVGCPSTRTTRSMVVFSVENDLAINDGRISVAPAPIAHCHEKLTHTDTCNDESKTSSNLGNNGKHNAPRLNLSNNKVAPSPYERDDKTVTLMIPESEEAAQSMPSPIPSSTSYDSLADVCRICHDNPSKLQLMMPCRCKGSMGMVHLSCLERWLSESGKNACEICGHEYNTVRKPKFTGLSALIAWIRKPITANDTRNLFFDIACFFILTPLAAVSGWLCVSGAQTYTLDNRFYTPRRMADKSEPSNSTWTAVGLLSLTATVAVAYLVWLFIAIRYHRTVFREWQMRNYTVTIVPFDGSGPVSVPIQAAATNNGQAGQVNNRNNAENENNNVNVAEDANNNENNVSSRISHNENSNCAVNVNSFEDELIFASVYENDSMDRIYDHSAFLAEMILNDAQNSVPSSANQDSEPTSSDSSQ